MRRLHLFEFGDLPWIPTLIRNYMTDFLRCVSTRFKLYRPLVPVLADAVTACGDKRIVDIASGGGGGYLDIVDELAKRIPGLKILLTDLYPSIAAFERITSAKPTIFEFTAKSVDAKAVPPELVGFRTQFLSLHHFRKEDVEQIVQNAVSAGVGFAAFELQRRDLFHLARFIAIPILVLVITPLIRPFRLSRLLLTYVIPILPLLIMWDGLVSVLRTHTEAELKRIVDGLEYPTEYQWTFGDAGTRVESAAYMIGVPVNASKTDISDAGAHPSDTPPSP